MRRVCRPALILVFLTVIPLPAWSVVVEMKNGTVVRGVLVGEDESRLSVRTEGGSEPVTVDRADVRRVHRAADPARLATLDPAEPSDYYRYAQEVAGNSTDPEAAREAIRLYLFAAHLAPERYGYRSLVRMAGLARDAAEARRFKSMAYLLDLLGDGRILQGESPDEPTGEARAEFIAALSAYRRGKSGEALEHALKEGVRDCFKAVPGLPGYDEFVRACRQNPECTRCAGTGRVFCTKCGGAASPACPSCKGKGWAYCGACDGQPRPLPVPDELRRTILKIEAAHEALQRQQADGKTRQERDRWSTTIRSGRMPPMPVLSLLHLTEFDPRRCLYRDGKWVAPEEPGDREAPPE